MTIDWSMPELHYCPDHDVGYIKVCPWCERERVLGVPA